MSPIPKSAIRTLYTTVLLALLPFAPATAADVIVSTFDSSTEGWSALGDNAAPASFSSTGGNPVGCLTVIDGAAGVVTYFVAPASFLGDKSVQYGGTLSFDQRQSYAAAPSQFDDVDIVLEGAGLRLVFNTPANPANNVWTSYAVTMAEGGGWTLNVLGGTAPTRAQMESVLANVTSLRIRSEFQNGPVTDSLDNVKLTPGSGPGPILAATHVDFSTAGFTGTVAVPTAQTPVNGLTYGYYEGTNSTTGAFSTAGMGPPGWSGNQGFGTPAHGYLSLHPGTGSTRSAVARRYTVGAGGEPEYSGEVRIVGRFSDIDTGAVDAFIILDPDGDAGAGARSFLVPATPVNGAQASVAFDFTATVGPNATIDFGALAGASGDFDAIGFHAWIVTGDTAVPTQIVASSYSSVISLVTASTDLRSVAAAMATDGVVSGADEATFDTTLGAAAHPYQFAGLLYLENTNSGKATRFDSVQIDVTSTGDFADVPRLYLLRENLDPASNNPTVDNRYDQLPVAPVRIAANSAGQPAYTFDLTGLPTGARTGFGFAVVGAGIFQGNAIVVSEISASAVRVPRTVAPIISETEFPLLDPVTHTGGFTDPAGGNGPYTWEVLSGNFPPHLLLNPDGTIQLSGLARVNGTYTFTIRVNDVNGVPGDKQFTIVVADPIPHSNGIVAWLPGEDAVGEIIGGRHGSLKNGATFGAGKVGRGFALDGVNDYIEVADHDSLDITGDLSIEAWIQTTTTSCTIVGKRDPDNSDVTYVFFLRNSILHFASRVGGGAFFEVSSGAVVPSGLSHVAVTISGTTLKMFVNGTAVSQTTSAVRSASTGPLTIGGTVTNDLGLGGLLSGAIDELSLYSRALMDAEIVAIYNAGSGGKARFDAGRQFSLAPQVAGSVWTYGRFPSETIDTTQFVLNITPWTDGPELAGWILAGAEGVVGINITDNLVIRAGARYHPPHQVFMHPSTTSMAEPAVVRWTAPEAGRYAVSATFLDTDVEGGAIKGIKVYHGATELYTDSISGFMGDGKSVTLPRTVAAGETVDFILTRGADNTAFADLAGLHASVVYLGPPLTIDQTAFPEKPEDPQVPWKLTASGGTAPYTFAVIDGTLPAAITIEADGEITGELTEFGRFAFTVEVTDAEGLTAEREFSIVVAQEFAPPADLAAWFPGELHGHDVVGGDRGVVVGSTISGPYGPGKSGRGFVFNGVDDSVEVASNSLNQLPLTIEAWIKPELRTDGSAADFFPPNVVSGDLRNFGGHGFGVNVFPDGSHLWIDVQHDQVTEGFREIPDVTFTAGQWAHVALVLSEGNAKTYVNGELVDDFDFPQGTMDAEALYRIGRHNEDTGYGAKRFFKGAIDEVSVYRRALDGEEILGIYNADSLGKTRDDAARDFLTDTNAAGQRWQYGQMGTGLAPVTTTFAHYAEVGTENALRFWRNAGQPDPNVIKNVTENPYLHWEAGRLSVHPGPDANRLYSAVRWTAPASGTYAVFADFKRLNTEAGTVSLHLRHNDSAIAGADDAVLVDQGAGTQIAGTALVQAGDVIDFIVGNHGTFGFDATGLAPSIVLVSSGPKIANVDFPTAAPGSLNVNGALTVEGGSGPFTVTLIFGALPTGLTLRPDGTVVGTLSENGIFTFTLQVTRGGLTSSRSFTVTVSNVPPPPLVAPSDQLVLLGGGKKAKNGAVLRQDAKFSFTAGQGGDRFLDLRMIVQYSATPQADASWTDFAGNKLTRTKAIDGSTKWASVPSVAIPVGQNLFFRTVTSAKDYSPSVGPVNGGVHTPIGPFTIEPTPLILLTLRADSDSDDSGRTVHPEESIKYFITAKNVGSAAAEGLVYGMKIPKNTEFRSGLDGGGAGVLTELPRGAVDSKITSVQWDFGTLAVNGEAIGRVTVKVKKPKGKPQLPYGTIITGDGVFAKYAGKLAPSDETVVKTEVTPAVSITLEPLNAFAVRGGTVAYKLTAINTASYDARESKAYFRVPRGTRVSSLPKADGSGNFVDFAAAAPDPQESNNPTLTPWKFDAVQVVKWDLGTIPGTDSTLNETLRTREMFVFLEVKHDVLPTQLFNGVYRTTELSAFGWNLFFTPPSGGSIPVYAYGGPEKRTPVSGEDLFSPPKLGIEKFAAGDTIFRSQKVKGDDTFAGDVVGVHQGSSILYRVHFYNRAETGEGSAVRCSIQERVANGLTFQGFLKISPTGAPGDERELTDREYRFFDAKGKLLSGDPYFDNGNGVYDVGETYIDIDRNGKFTPRGDIRKTEWIVFDIGTLNPGANGYVTYRCAATGAPGTLVKSDSYSLVSESLHEPITGAPRVMYARIVRGLSFDVQSRQSTTRIVPFDNSDRPEDSDVVFEAEIKNTGDLRANEADIAVDIPEGLSIISSTFSIAEGPTLLQPKVKGRTHTWLSELNPGEVQRVAIHCRALPTAQLSAKLRKLDSAIVFSPARVDGKYDPKQALNLVAMGIQSAAAEAESASATDKPVSASAEGGSGTVLLGMPNRAELWALKSAPLSQESRKNIRYLFVAGNSGNISATNVVAAFYIPPGTVFVGATAGYKRKGEVISWELGDIPPHSSLGFSVDVNIAHLDSGMVKDNSFVVKCDNAPEVVPFVTRTNVRAQPFQTGILTWFKNAVGAIGINLGGSTTAALQEDIGTLTTTSRTHAARGANMVWTKNGIGAIPNGGGQVVVVGPSGSISGGTLLTEGQGTMIVSGTGAEITANGVGSLSGQKLIDLVNEARTRNDRNAPNVFVCGNGRLIYYAGNQLVNNDTDAVFGSVQPKAGADLVAAGGLNLVAAGGGNIVAAGGLNTNGLVAAGGLNLVAAGGLNLVAAGAGNLTSIAGGNLVAAGGLNLVAAGGGNIVAAGGLNNGTGLVPAGGLKPGARLVGNDGSGFVDKDGNGLVGNDGNGLVGNDGNSLIGNDGGTLISDNGAVLIGNDGGTLVGAGAGN